MFEHLKTIGQLASFLGIGVHELKKLKPSDHYVSFQIPKPGSEEKRTIEAPTGILKYILDRLADCLQWSYSDHRTQAAHGYIRAVKNDPDKRTIFTNANKHLGKKYLLNIDLDSFFYQIDDRKVRIVFSDNRFFAFNPETIELLVRFVCFHERLPMGSPTSPPLSNFATMDLDTELSMWTRHQRITYTRFVDDLSFSSNRPLTAKHFEIISDTLRMHHFTPDPEKIKWYGEDDLKEVTGLIVGKKISLPSEYLNELNHELKRLKEVKQYALLYPDYPVLEWVQKLDKVMAGKIAFVKAVYGRENIAYKQLLKDYQLTNLEPDPLSMSWRYAGYEYFSS